MGMQLFMSILPEGMSIFGSGGGGIGSGLETFKMILIGLLIFVVVVGGTGIVLYRKANNKKYNIPLIIVTPRSDGRVVEVSNGMGGYFKSKRVGGITSFRVKRKGIGIIEIPPPLSSFLTSPNRTLFLAQKGVDDYQPISPEQLNFVNTETDVEEEVINERGEKSMVKKVYSVKQPILNLKGINQDATAWLCDNEESAKKRFTMWSLWEKYQVMITLMMFVFILFLILYINWIGMKDVVAGLKDVVEVLRSTSAPIITPGG